MERLELIAPCHFGLEAVLKREILELGYEIIRVEDGRILFEGDAEAVCRANIYLRTAERILIKAGEFHAETFEELFQGTKAIPWEHYIPVNGKFYVTKAASVKSKLFSPSDIQSILHKDEVLVGIDTTGESLHKRGYRKLTARAPIAENLAAALIMLTPWRGNRILVDPFCGSGTFPIEAAMMAAHMAPGVNRSFTAMTWNHLIPEREWTEVREEAKEEIDLNVETDIQGYDLDETMVEYARQNARLAGVDRLIHFQKRGVDQLSHSKKYGFVITNPPYGERLEEKEALFDLYHTIGERFKKLDDWSLYLITSYDKAQEALGLKADKNRKIYNGMMKTYFYQFPGPKPPKKNP